MAHPPFTRRTALLLVVLFGANFLVILAQYAVLFVHHRSITTVRVPPPDWIGVVRYGTYAGQLFTLSLVGGMATGHRWIMWLCVLPFALLLNLLVMPEADRRWSGMLWYILEHFDRHTAYMSEQLLVLFYVNLMAPLFMLIGGILVLSVLCWPMKVFLGWRLVGGTENPPVVGRVSTWQMMLWIGLWSALFFISTQARDYYGTQWPSAAGFAVPVVLLVGFPVAVACSGQRIRWFVWLAILAYVLVLSYAESELSYLVASISPPGSAGIPLVYPLFLNGTIAAVVAANLLILRACGLRLHMPFRTPPRLAAGVENCSATASEARS
jgi:hypothetical protein